MIRMHIDVEMTRRKRFILIMSEAEEELWRGRKLTDAINWLYEENYRDVQIDTGETRYHVTVSRLTDQEEPYQWPK